MPPASQHLHFRIVQSRQNASVKELRACLGSGSPSSEGIVGIEGEHLLQEALRSGVETAAIFIRSGEAHRVAGMLLPNGTDLIELSPDLFASAVTTESPQGVAALVRPKVFSLDDAFAESPALLLVAAGLQDPGNLGTLIRSAEAFGASGVALLPGTVSPWNAKAMRASSGSVFRLPVVSVNERELFSQLQAQGVRIAAAVADGGISADETNLTGPAALLIGNEGRGLPGRLLQRANDRITIRCPGPVESLNAAIAGSILLYEASRQRFAPGTR